MEGTAIQYIPVAGQPSHLKTVREIEGMLSVRIDPKLLRKRRGDGGKEYTYVPWEKTLEILNDTFGAFGWGNSDPLSYYVEEGRTFVVVKSLTISGYDPSSGCVVLVTKTNTGRAVSNGNNDTAAAAADSDSLSRVAKLLGFLLGAHLSDPDDPAHQEAGSNPTSSGTTNGRSGNTWATGRGSAQQPRSQQTSSSGGSWANADPTGPMLNALRRNNVPEGIIARLNKQQAGDMIGYFKEQGDYATLDGALAKAGVVGFAVIGEAEEAVEEIPF